MAVKDRFMKLLYAGLFLFITALFILACNLNYRQYQANIKSIKSGYLEILNHESDNIRTRIRTLEREVFSLFTQTNLPPEAYASNNLCNYTDGRFTPAGLTNTVPENRNDPRWKLADEMGAAASNRPAPFRIPLGDSILSVNSKGQACLLPAGLFDDGSNSVVEVSIAPPTVPTVASRALRYPPIYAWIPESVFESSRRSADDAYLLTNIMLAVILAIIVALAFGLVILVRRQHEVAAMKQSFVSAVSHELRTPMSLIRLYAESLAAENPPPGSRERYSKSILSETDRLTALVNNVLDLARLEKGVFTLDIKPVDVSLLCSDTLDSFNFRLEKEQIALTRKIEPGLTAMVDPLAMTQVIFNIIDNAIKYSGSRHAIEVQMTKVNGRIRLRVSDNGIGIPAAFKPMIFMPFVRGEDSRVTSQRGSGIGLSISIGLLERMNCSIECSDNDGGGTVFEIMMPPGSAQ